MPEQNELEQNEELQRLRARVGELEETLAQRDAGLTEASARITELEQAADESRDKLNNLNERLIQAVSSYRTLVTQSNPEVIEDLITGESIEEIDSSLGRAKSLIDRVRSGLDAEAARARVPAGSPPRLPVDLSALSPGEKIRYAISQGGKH